MNSSLRLPLTLGLFILTALLVLASILVNPDGVDGSFNESLVVFAIVGMVLGAATYGLGSGLRNLLPQSARYALGLVALIILGFVSFVEIDAQLSGVGFAASARSANYPAALLAGLGVAAALWHALLVAKPTKRFSLAMITGWLISLNFFLYFNSW